MCSPELSPRAFQNALYTTYNSHLIQMQQYRLFADKIKMQMMTPSYEQNHDPELSLIPAGIPG